MRICFVIIVVFWIFLVGCRSQRHIETTETRMQANEIGMEFHGVESLWNSIAEKLLFEIEFYPNPHLSTGDLSSMRDADSSAASLGLAQHNSGGEGSGTAGGIKAIRIVSETATSSHEYAEADSTADWKSAETTGSHFAKETETRQDTGAWPIVAVAILASLIVFYFVLNIVLNKMHRK